MEDQVFDILSLWAPVFSRNPENQINQTDDLTSTVRLASFFIYVHFSLRFTPIPDIRFDNLYLFYPPSTLLLDLKGFVSFCYSTAAVYLYDYVFEVSKD